MGSEPEQCTGNRSSIFSSPLVSWFAENAAFELQRVREWGKVSQYFDRLFISFIHLRSKETLDFMATTGHGSRLARKAPFMQAKCDKTEVTFARINAVDTKSSACILQFHVYLPHENNFKGNTSFKFSHIMD